VILEVSIQATLIHIQIKSKATVQSGSKMAINTLETISEIKPRAKESIGMQMVTSTKDTGKTIKPMAMESISQSKDLAT